MPTHRFGPRSPRVTVGQVYAALVADPWAQKQLNTVYQKLFEGEGVKRGSAPDYYAHVQPSKAKSEINALAEWAGEQFGQPGPMVPKKTPFTYISVPKWNGWITLFSVVAHGGDVDLTRDFNETVAGMSWTSAGVSRIATASGAPAAPTTPSPPHPSPSLPSPPPPPPPSVWSRVRSLMPARGTVTGAQGSPPTPPPPPGILERALGASPPPPRQATAHTPPIPVAAYESVPTGTARGEEDENEEERIARELERIKQVGGERISAMMRRRGEDDDSVMRQIVEQADEWHTKEGRKRDRVDRMLLEKLKEEAPARPQKTKPVEEVEEEKGAIALMRRPAGVGEAFG